jgi:DNA ligase-3
MDAKTGAPLPFGTLGIHKKKAHQDATVCVFIFDILLLNGESLLELPFIERRKLLESSIKPVSGRVVLSEVHYPKGEEELKDLFFQTVTDNIEGLMVKDIKGKYEANKRHWIKLKKEHFQGMADSADLIVLGAFFGTGAKGGLKSIFLMGVYDESEDNFKTVCRVGNGFSDEELHLLQTSLKVVKIEKDPERCPKWLVCKKRVQFGK